jgi:hypothetical protein
MSLVKVFIERAQVDAIRSRAIPNTGELEYLQKVWVYKAGSRFPTEYQIRLPAGVKLYPEGDYVLDLQTNIKPDKYLGLSFDPFAPAILRPVTPQFIETFDKLSEQLYQQLLHPAPSAHDAMGQTTEPGTSSRVIFGNRKPSS